MNKTGIEYLQSEEKRRLDVVGGAILTLLTLPVGAATGVISAADTKSFNPMFLQERLGGVNNKFLAYKFRTISPRLGEMATLKTFGTFDPRATKTGMFLRQSGLDEWPQMINVLEGKMSLVGPRPLIEDEIADYEAVDKALFDEWYEGYCSVKSGIFGDTQFYKHRFKNVTDGLRIQSMRMDIDYFENATLAGDISLIARSPFSILTSNLNVTEAT
jgi:lipopolysaccharide/colanic/teichoic acid biosynthesis glycosyltransferase